MKQKSPLSILNILTKDSLSQQDILQHLSLEPPLKVLYPLDILRQLSRQIKQRHLHTIEYTLRDILLKHKFPCFQYSLRQLSLLFHLCIITNPNYYQTAYQFTEHLLSKMHLYSLKSIEGETKVSLDDNLIFVSEILDDLVPLLFEKGQFAAVFKGVLTLANNVANSMQLIALWVLGDKIQQNLDEEGSTEFGEMLRRMVTNKECLGLLNRMLRENRGMLDVSYLAILRKKDDALEKYNLLIDQPKVVDQIQREFVFPSEVKAAYNSAPGRPSSLFMSSRVFKDVFQNLVMLEVFCNSPLVEELQQHFEEEALGLFVRFIKGERFLEENTESKLEKWILILRDIQKTYADHRHLQQIKGDVLRLVSN